MVAVDNEAGGKAVFGKLIPNEILTPGQGGTGSVAEVSGESRAGADRILNLPGGRFGVADADHDALASDVVDIARGIRPLRRERDQPDVALRGFLPTLELVEVGRAHPLGGMGSAGTVVRGDVRSFYMEGFDRSGGFTERFLGSSQVLDRGEHGIGRAGDDGWKESRDAGRM